MLIHPQIMREHTYSVIFDFPSTTMLPPSSWFLMAAAWHCSRNPGTCTGHGLVRVPVTGARMMWRQILSSAINSSISSSQSSSIRRFFLDWGESFDANNRFNGHWTGTIIPVMISSGLTSRGSFSRSHGLDLLSRDDVPLSRKRG
jgi:hypothetical protein